MKKLILFLNVIVLVLCNSANAQITNDYPFKTFLDSINNLYVSGSKFNPGTNSLDIIYEKYNSGGENLILKWYNNIGNDRGMDISVDRNGNAFITGYVYNKNSNSNDIICLKFNQIGTLLWSKILINPGDDKGFGLDFEISSNNKVEEIYLSGYITKQNSQKNICVIKLDEYGDLVWQRDTAISGKYDIATDIFVDAGHVYTCGYSYQGPVFGDDIFFITLDKIDGYIGTNEIGRASCRERV